MLLRPAYAARLEFRKRGEDVLATGRTWRITFVERGRPTIVRSLKNDNVPIEGTLWIEPASGRVLKTLVKTIGTPDPGSAMVNASAQTLMRVEVTFAPSDALGVLVPEQMVEWSRASDLTEVTGTATYSRFRRVAVATTETIQTDPAGNCVVIGSPKPSQEFSYRVTDSRNTSSDYTSVWDEVTPTSSRVRTTRGRTTVDAASRYRIVDDVSVVEETVQSDAGTTTFAPGIIGDPFGRTSAGRSWPIASSTATNRSARGTFATKTDAGELKMLGLHERVTVAAGTFDTVHYTRTTTSAARGTVVDEYWKSIEHGVVVKHQSAAGGVKLTEELQSIR